MGCGPWYQNVVFRKTKLKTFLFKKKNYTEKWIRLMHNSVDCYSDLINTAITQEMDHCQYPRVPGSMSPKCYTHMSGLSQEVYSDGDIFWDEKLIGERSSLEKRSLFLLFLFLLFWEYYIAEPKIYIFSILIIGVLF